MGLGITGREIRATTEWCDEVGHMAVWFKCPGACSGDSLLSDSKFGGKGKAYEAAVKCRDEELKKRPAMNSYEQAIRPKRTNKSGIVGVRKGEKIVRHEKKFWIYPAWIATGTPVSGGKTKTKYFVISVFGSSRAAKEAAIEQRKEWEECLRKNVETKLTGAS